MQFPFLRLVICTGIFLLAAQITVTAFSGCCGCCKSCAIPSETKRIVGIICAVGSWIVTAIALVLLLFGFFAGTGVLALVSTALGITSYILMRSEPADAAASGPNRSSHQQQQQQPPVVIMVGQPQLSPTEVAAGAQTKPAVGQHLPAGFVAMGHPQSSPAVAAASVRNKPSRN